MDFMNRGQQPNGRPSTIFSAGAATEPDQPAPQVDQKPKEDKPEKPGKRHHLVMENNRWFRWGGSALVIIVAILIAAALALFLTFRPSAEGDLVDSNRLQAVFLTNDQVYFGRITSINSKYLVLNSVYYLQTAASSTSTKSATGSNVSLVKLGCELHKPQDQMVVSQQQVSFWENLQTDGQVASAVKKYEEAHPNGQTCDATNATTNPVQGGTGNTSNTNNTNTNNAQKAQ